MSIHITYVSGKYTDPRGAYYVYRNIEEARRVSAIFWALGVAVICPHGNTHHFDGITDYETFMEGDLAMVERCDSLILLPSYITSNGAQQEQCCAITEKLPVYLWPNDLHYFTSHVFPDGVPVERMEKAKSIMTEEEIAHANRCRLK